MPAVNRTESYQQNCFDTKLLFSQRVFLDSPGPAVRTGETCKTAYELSAKQATEAACANHSSCWHTLNLLPTAVKLFFFQIWKKNNCSFIFSSKSSRNIDMTFRGMLQKMGEIMGPLKQWINGENVFSYIIHHPDKICTCSVREETGYKLFCAGRAAWCVLQSVKRTQLGIFCAQQFT